jgi:hypothetical protein
MKTVNVENEHRCHERQDVSGEESEESEESEVNEDSECRE